MSYFCANSISFDKKELLYKVKGGDNNVVPRSNEWSYYFPISKLIREVSGGMIQFTTRKDKNILVERLAYKYDKKIFELTGLSSYEAVNLPTEPEETLKKYKRLPAGHWNRDVIAKQILVLKDSKKLKKILELKDQFVKDILELKVDKSKFIIFN